ncbi:unnamed protein product [Ranitomeya imitator]|uniref:ETS domain-containing protein n=1 Tax=Ranitomeya imitator TaxID=111125 RepID=A0ABN9MJ64_9NEOB|nr:unnamed protein product [Ranitomeya imitator]
MEKRKTTKELSEDLRNQIVRKHEQSQGYKSISKDLNAPLSTVRSVIKKFKALGTVASLPRCGRKRKIDKRFQRKIVRMLDKEPQLTSKQVQAALQSEGTTVSTRTIRWRLNEKGLYGRRPRKTLLLTPRHKKARLEFAKTYLKKPKMFWKNVLWSSFSLKVAFHSPPVKIKKEQPSPCSDPSLSCSQKQFQYRNGEQCLYASAYDQTSRQVNIKSPNQGAQVSPIAHFPRQDRGYVNPQSSSQSAQSGGYLMEHGSRYQQQLPEMCQSFPSTQNMNRESSANYQRQMSEPCVQYPQQSFKQEYHDPMYDQASHAGTSRPHRYQSNVIVKQEQTDYAYDSGQRLPAELVISLLHFTSRQWSSSSYSDVPGCQSMYRNVEGYPNMDGYGYEKPMRSFPDDACVVPEKFEAGDIKQEVGTYRDGPPYQRRGSLQLWQFLVALLDDPANSHFIAWTGRGMEFKLIEPEEQR